MTERVILDEVNVTRVVIAGSGDGIEFDVEFWDEEHSCRSMSRTVYRDPVQGCAALLKTLGFNVTWANTGGNAGVISVLSDAE